MVNQHCREGETRRSYPSFGGDIGMSVKNSLEMLIEVLNSFGAELVKQTPHLHSYIGVRIRAL